MKQSKIPAYKILIPGVLLSIFTASFFASCNSCNRPLTNPNTINNPDSVPPVKVDTHYTIGLAMAGTVKELWSGSTTTHANDSVIYASSGNLFTLFTDSSGNFSDSRTPYTQDSQIIMEACANHEICSKMFNKAINNARADSALRGPVFSITSASGTIPVKIFAQDTAGNAHASATIQLYDSANNIFGGAAKTAGNGSCTYSSSLNPNSRYKIVASGPSPGTGATYYITTTPLSGTSGSLSGIAVYVRY